MARLKPNTVRDTGAHSGDVLVGNLQTNKGMRIQVDQDQVSRQAQSRPNSKLIGTFTLLDAGQGTYVSLLQPFIGRQWTAAKLVQAMRKIDPTLNPWKTFATENLLVEITVRETVQPRMAGIHPNSPDHAPRTGGSPPIAFGNESLGDLQTGADFAVPTRERSLGDLETGLDADSSLSDLDDHAGEFENTAEIVDLETRYEIGNPLGKGGMGEVLRATDTRLKRPVAIKRMKGELGGSRKAMQRFLTEAQSIAQLNHFNIVQIYDYGQTAEGPFIVMELVEGQSLAGQLRDGPLEPEQAIAIISQLCDALRLVHERGIVHRDIKPANILMTTDGIPKLTDFGLARQEASDDGQTRTGTVGKHQVQAMGHHDSASAGGRTRPTCSIQSRLTTSR